jgi:hypothetical protein
MQYKFKIQAHFPTEFAFCNASNHLGGEGLTLAGLISMIDDAYSLSYAGKDQGASASMYAAEDASPQQGWLDQEWAGWEGFDQDASHGQVGYDAYGQLAEDHHAQLAAYTSSGSSNGSFGKGGGGKGRRHSATPRSAPYPVGKAGGGKGAAQYQPRPQFRNGVRDELCDNCGLGHNVAYCAKPGGPFEHHGIHAALAQQRLDRGAGGKGGAGLVAMSYGGQTHPGMVPALTTPSYPMQQYQMPMVMPQQMMMTGYPQQVQHQPQQMAMMVHQQQHQQMMPPQQPQMAMAAMAYPQQQQMGPVRQIGAPAPTGQGGQSRAMVPGSVGWGNQRSSAGGYSFSTLAAEMDFNRAFDCAMNAMSDLFGACDPSEFIVLDTGCNNRSVRNDLRYFVWGVPKDAPLSCMIDSQGGRTKKPIARAAFTTMALDPAAPAAAPPAVEVDFQLDQAVYNAECPVSLYCVHNLLFDRKGNERDNNIDLKQGMLIMQESSIAPKRIPLQRSAGLFLLRISFLAAAMGTGSTVDGASFVATSGIDPSNGYVGSNGSTPMDVSYPGYCDDASSASNPTCAPSDSPLQFLKPTWSGERPAAVEWSREASSGPLGPTEGADAHWKFRAGGTIASCAGAYFPSISAPVNVLHTHFSSTYQVEGSPVQYVFVNPSSHKDAVHIHMNKVNAGVAHKPCRASDKENSR